MMANHQTKYTTEWGDFSDCERFTEEAQAGLEPDGQIAGDDCDGLLEWDDEWDVNDSDDLGEADWDEPDPIAEYDSELRQQLYVIENDDDILVSEFRIDWWITTNLVALSSVQRDEIAGLLRNLNPSRRRRWLPWISRQPWTNDSLLLFLRFRELWDANPHWWESTFWDWRAGCWHPTRNRYSLSLNDAYDLVTSRLGFRPREVIDEAWLSDWIDLELWQHGFRSFASFAVFRARFGNSENWIRHLDWHDQGGHSGDGAETNRRINVYQRYHYGPPLWFSEQDWYDPSDWHDNLGW